MLIVDEVLAVGDAEFPRRCLGKMQSVAGSGQTVLFVSHNVGAIQHLCSRAIALRNGRVVDEGEPGDVIAAYLASMSQEEHPGFSRDNPERGIKGDVYLTGGWVLNKRDESCHYLNAGEPVTIELNYENPTGHRTFDIAIVIRNSSGYPVLLLEPRYTGFEMQAERSGTIRCTLPRLPLPTGDYRVAVLVRANQSKSDNIPNAMLFSVETSTFLSYGGKYNVGFCRPPQRFNRACRSGWRRAAGP